MQWCVKCEISTIFLISHIIRQECLAYISLDKRSISRYTFMHFVHTSKRLIPTCERVHAHKHARTHARAQAFFILCIYPHSWNFGRNSGSSAERIVYLNTGFKRVKYLFIYLFIYVFEIEEGAGNLGVIVVVVCEPVFQNLPRSYT